RLWPDEHVSTTLILGEGVETTITAAVHCIHRGTLLRPAWATGCAGNLEHFPLLAGIEALTLLVDHDKSGRGQEAARACGKRWRDPTRNVPLRTPDARGPDFNDWARP